MASRDGMQAWRTPTRGTLRMTIMLDMITRMTIMRARTMRTMITPTATTAARR